MAIDYEYSKNSVIWECAAGHPTFHLPIMIEVGGKSVKVCSQECRNALERRAAEIEAGR